MYKLSKPDQVITVLKTVLLSFVVCWTVKAATHTSELVGN